VTAYSTDIDTERLLRLSEEVTRIAGNLAKLSMGVGAPRSALQTNATTAENQSTTEVSPDAVRWVVTARRERARYLSSELFADPAWDILLDLLEAELAQHRVSVSSLCIAAGVPATTGLRWISNMVKQGLLVRHPDRNDGRRAFIELAPEVSTALRRYFADVVEPRRNAALDSGNEAVRGS
jgi:DNA-binding MarR family transcriptional regulator